MSDDFTPAEALASVQTQRDKLAAQAASPPGYHVMLGLLVGVLIGSTFSQDVVVVIVVYAACALCGWGLVTYYKRTKGMWVNGLTERPAKRWARAAGAIAGGGFALGVVLELLLDVHGAGLVLAVVAAPVVAWLGYRWDAAYERELRDAP